MNKTAFKELTRLEQSVFGLPFVLSGALLSFYQHPFLFEWRWLWILPAFFLARISGMAFNQLIDRTIDASNPRTQGRVLPTGRMAIWQARVIAWGSLVLFIGVCSQINILCFWGSLFAAFLLWAYSYTKRFSLFCHYVLGLIHLLAPLMAWIAMTGTLAWPPFFLGLSSLFLIGGNDILYALQDVAFDQKHRLHSIPSKLGIGRGIKIAKLSHGCSVLSLFFCGWIGHYPWIFFGAPVGIALFFWKSHRKIKEAVRENQSIFRLFFISNLFVALMVMIFSILTVLWAAM